MEPTPKTTSNQLDIQLSTTVRAEFKQIIKNKRCDLCKKFPKEEIWLIITDQLRTSPQNKKVLTKHREKPCYYIQSPKFLYKNC